MQQDPRPKKLHSSSANKQHHLSYQNQVNKINITGVYPNIYHRLSKKGEDELENATCQ